jgi:hypothetical protein
MGLQGNCQNTSTEEKNRITTYITDKGDTMVSMSIEDAKTLLEDVLNYEYSDSLLTVYKERDSLNTKTITLQKEVNNNLEEVIKNKNKELKLKENTIEEQKKEIKKQKTFKIFGLSGSVILPIITVLLIL